MREEVLDRVWAAIGLLDSVVKECAVVIAEGKGGGVGSGSRVVDGRAVGADGGRVLGGELKGAGIVGGVGGCVEATIVAEGEGRIG